MLVAYLDLWKIVWSIRIGKYKSDLVLTQGFKEVRYTNMPTENSLL